MVSLKLLGTSQKCTEGLNQAPMIPRCIPAFQMAEENKCNNVPNFNTDNINILILIYTGLLGYTQINQLLVRLNQIRLYLFLIDLE